MNCHLALDLSSRAQRGTLVLACAISMLAQANTKVPRFARDDNLISSAKLLQPKKRGDLPLDMPGGCIPTSGSPIDMTLPRDIMLLMQKLCRRKRLSKYRKT